MPPWHASSQRLLAPFQLTISHAIALWNITWVDWDPTRPAPADPIHSDGNNNRNNAPICMDGSCQSTFCTHLLHLNSLTHCFCNCLWSSAAIVISPLSCHFMSQLSFMLWNLRAKLPWDQLPGGLFFHCVNLRINGTQRKGQERPNIDVLLLLYWAGSKTIGSTNIWFWIDNDRQWGVYHGEAVCTDQTVFIALQMSGATSPNMQTHINFVLCFCQVGVQKYLPASCPQFDLP